MKEKCHFNRRSGDWDVLVVLRLRYLEMYSANCLFCCRKCLNFSTRICNVKPKKAKNLRNTHHTWQHLTTPQKKDPRSGCSEGFRLRSPIKFSLINVTSSMLLMMSSCFAPRCLNMPKLHPLMHHMRLRAAPFTSVIAPPSTKLRLWAIFINSTKRAWYLVPYLSDSNNRSNRINNEQHKALKREKTRKQKWESQHVILMFHTLLREVSWITGPATSVSLHF